MSAAKILEVQGWELVVGEDDRPMVRDVDLGARLGFARPRKFRELVARLIASGALQSSEWRPTVGRQSSTGRGGHRGPVTEYHLSQRGALIAIAKSDTPLADTITRQMVDVFMAYLEGRLAPAVKAVPIAEVHGSRVGETISRAELVLLCVLATERLGVTIHRVHGALRRQFKVASAYHLALSVWPTARAFLEALVQGKLYLEAPTARARPSLRLLQGGAQLAMPWGGR